MCKETANIVEVGKCKDCKMEVLNIQTNRELAKRFGVTSVPSIVIDGEIKVVGRPTFPWFCGDGFYKMLKTKYPLRATGTESSGRFELLSSCGGSFGAALCTITMMLPILVGTAGAGASVACSMPGMCGGTQLTGVLGTFVNGMTPVAQPLLAASVALILYGLRRFGRWPLAISAFGGALLYFSMFILAMSLALIAVSSAILFLGYGIAYLTRHVTHFNVTS